MVSTGFAVAGPDFFYPGRKDSGKKLEKNFRIFPKKFQRKKF